MNLRTGIFLCFAAFGASACVKSNTSSASAVGGKLLDILLPRPHASLKYDAISQALVDSAATVARDAAVIDPRRKLEEAYLKEAAGAGGIPSWQGKRIIGELVDDTQGRCGGASCQKVFGITPDEIDEFFWGTHEKLQRDAKLAAPENAALKDSLVGSTVVSEDPWVDGAPVEKKPLEVVFNSVKDTYKKAFATLQTGQGPLFASIDVTPSDLVNAKSLVCDDRSCEVLVDKKFKVGANVPVAMHPEISLTYKRTTDANGLIVARGGTVELEATPLKLGPLLRAKLRFRTDIMQQPATSMIPVIKSVDCAGLLVCKLPLINFKMIVDRKGIEFEGVAEDGLGGNLLKATPKFKTDPITYGKIADPIRAMREGVIQETGGASSVTRPDIDWDDFVDGAGI